MSLKKNILFNYTGNVITALVGFAFVPWCIKEVGIESFGLIGFYTTLSTMLTLFDLGLGAAAAREMSIIPENDKENKARELIATVEKIFLILSILIGVTIWFLAPVVNAYWIKSQVLSGDQVVNTLQIMGIALATQFLFSLYVSCLAGLRRQAAVNIINASFSLLRFVFGAVILLKFKAIEYFFAWQVAVSILGILVSRNLLISLKSWKFFYFYDPSLIKKIKRFAIAISSINILSMLVIQLDKLVLSSFLSLKSYGYFMTAWTLASIFYRVSGPVYMAVYPELSASWQARDNDKIERIFSNSTQLVSLFLIPAALFLVFFDKELVSIWIQDAGATKEVVYYLPFLVLGTFLNCLSQIPFALQLAAGWTKPGVLLSISALVLEILILVVVISHSANPGLAWFIANLVSFICGNILTYRKFSKVIKLNWIKDAILVPILSVSATFLVIKLILILKLITVTNIFALISVFFIAMITAALSIPLSRRKLKEILFQNSRGSA